jgi:hypothetical protein
MSAIEREQWSPYFINHRGAGDARGELTKCHLMATARPSGEVLRFAQHDKVMDREQQLKNRN